MGQNEVLIFQPTPSVSISKCAASMISVIDPDKKEQNFSFLIYPDLDSIRVLTIKQLNADLPNKIVFLICVKRNMIDIRKVTAVFNSKLTDLDIGTFKYIGIYMLKKEYNNLKNDSTLLSIPLKLNR